MLCLLAGTENFLVVRMEDPQEAPPMAMAEVDMGEPSSPFWLQLLNMLLINMLVTEVALDKVRAQSLHPRPNLLGAHGLAM
jgi:hypothetical protein